MARKKSAGAKQSWSASSKKRPTKRGATPSGNAVLDGIDEYIKSFPPEVRAILEKIRSTIRAAAPGAVEKISYRMPAFFLDGVLLYFAAFKQHIGVYPPVKGDAKLMKDLAPYLGEKGNLKFPLDEPMPYGLIKRVVQARLKEMQAKAAAKRLKKS